MTSTVPATAYAVQAGRPDGDVVNKSHAAPRQGPLSPFISVRSMAESRLFVLNEADSHECS
jgi:hypothetical protein